MSSDGVELKFGFEHGLGFAIGIGIGFCGCWGLSAIIWILAGGYSVCSYLAADRAFQCQLRFMYLCLFQFQFRRRQAICSASAIN